MIYYNGKCSQCGCEVVFTKLFCSAICHVDYNFFYQLYNDSRYGVSEGWLAVRTKIELV